MFSIDFAIINTAEPHTITNVVICVASVTQGNESLCCQVENIPMCQTKAQGGWQVDPNAVPQHAQLPLTATSALNRSRPLLNTFLFYILQQGKNNVGQ